MQRVIEIFNALESQIAMLVANPSLQTIEGIGKLTEVITRSSNQESLLRESLKAVRAAVTDGDIHHLEQRAFGHDLQNILTLLIMASNLFVENLTAQEKLQISLQNSLQKLATLRGEFFQPLNFQSCRVFVAEWQKAVGDFSRVSTLDVEINNMIPHDSVLLQGLIPAGRAFAIRLIMNILSNAARAYDSRPSLSRKVRIVSQIIQNDNSMRYQLQFEDEGPGFPNARTVSNPYGLFVPYTPNGDTHWQGNVTGTGAGLAGLMATVQPLLSTGKAGFSMGTNFVGDQIIGAQTTIWWEIHPVPLEDDAPTQTND